MQGKAQARDHVGIVEGSSGITARGVNTSIRGNSHYRETWGTRRGGGGRHVAKRSSDPRVAYPEVKVQVRDLVRFLGIVVPFAPREFGTLGKFV